MKRTGGASRKCAMANGTLTRAASTATAAMAHKSALHRVVVAAAGASLAVPTIETADPGNDDDSDSSANARSLAD